jgi:hypothetical protein
MNPRTGEREAYEGEHCENEIRVCDVEEDDCDPNYATCHHTGPGLHECTCYVGWDGSLVQSQSDSGSHEVHTCTDVDECASSPCENAENGGTCVESACEPSSFPDGTICDAEENGRPPIDQYRCTSVSMEELVSTDEATISQCQAAENKYCNRDAADCSSCLQAHSASLMAAGCHADDFTDFCPDFADFVHADLVLAVLALVCFSLTTIREIAGNVIR